MRDGRYLSCTNASIDAADNENEYGNVNELHILDLSRVIT